ncbi:MAG TPA: endonuclease MutS2 [Methylomirabilota bacterium]|jgi:DNA mismatch repair protein MutS2|nr:endonuclease MutS2 [Methylomirabilota bacterium]
MTASTTALRLSAGSGGLEWAEVLDLLARETRTAMGHERAHATTPVTDLAAIRRGLAETAQARAALAQQGAPPLDGIPDVRPTLEAARVPGSVAEGADLAALLPLIEAAARLRAYGRAIAPVAPDLAAAVAGVPQQQPLADLLGRSLDPDGQVRDEASPALRRLRQRIRDLRREIVKRLESYFNGPNADTTFQERYVTVRHGRYVLPIRAEAKGRLRGIVHDRSQSGATLFVEPEAMVEANNDLVQVAREEEAEVVRILAALTDAVREALPDLDALVAGIGGLDLIFARGALAERMEATEPAVGEDREIRLLGARNPLLLAQSWRVAGPAAGRGAADGEPSGLTAGRGAAEGEPSGFAVIPMDIEIGADRPLLVITGPNAGGKTVALKTLGLLALMAQSGCHVPARDGARLPVFSQLFAIVGDDQSVAENLSTFSAFVKQLREVLERVDDRSLVLLDELGAGTDPDDGAALAQAVLEALAGRGATVAASTHLEPLKGFASTYPKARNASVEFDAERLAPTFRLVYDRPGQSYALAIGARLGLPAALIERAHAQRSTQQRQLQELLARLDDRDRRDAERGAAIERREAESAGLLARAQAEMEAARTSARETMARARAEAQRLVAEVRRQVNDEWDRLKRADKSRPDLDRARKRLTETAKRVGEPAPAAAADAAAAPPAAGDRVEITHLGLKGHVVSLDGETATVQAGAITVKVPAQALRVLARGEGVMYSAPRMVTEQGTSRARSTVAVPGKSGVSVELHLIGRTTAEARDLLEKYLDDAFMAGLTSVRIIHGKGTGALRRAVEDLLSGHPLVAEHRPGAPSEGGAGATVATLSQG